MTEPESRMTDAIPQWESADSVEEGEHLFVYVHHGVAKYGVGIKAWQGAGDPRDYQVGNFPWAGRPTHAMKLPDPPSGQTFEDFIAPSRAQAQAAIYAHMEAEVLRLTKERDEAREALKEFMSCARCDPRMDGLEVFSHMDAGKFGRIWRKYKDFNAEIKESLKSSDEEEHSSDDVSHPGKEEV